MMVLELIKLKTRIMVMFVKPAKVNKYQILPKMSVLIAKTMKLSPMGMLNVHLAQAELHQMMQKQNASQVGINCLISPLPVCLFHSGLFSCM